MIDIKGRECSQQSDGTWVCFDQDTQTYYKVEAFADKDGKVYTDYWLRNKGD